MGVNTGVCIVAESCDNATACTPFAHALIQELLVIMLCQTSCGRLVSARAVSLGHPPKRYRNHRFVNEQDEVDNKIGNKSPLKANLPKCSHAIMYWENAI